MVDEHDILIRRATVADIPAIGKIINDCAEYGLMLPRSLASLYENVRDFHVAELPGIRSPASDVRQGRGGQATPHATRDTPSATTEIVGTCGLSIVWANLAEIMSLAIAPSHRGQGLGKQLAGACVEEAKALGIRQLMTLTYEQAFFEKLGFTVVDRQKLPLKVWNECVRCPKNQDCDEIAMIRELKDVPQIPVPKPKVPPEHEYIVPVVRRGRADEK